VRDGEEGFTPEGDLSGGRVGWDPTEEKVALDLVPENIVACAKTKMKNAASRSDAQIHAARRNEVNRFMSVLLGPLTPSMDRRL
jgi:hypothetical protein